MKSWHPRVRPWARNTRTKCLRIGVGRNNRWRCKWARPTTFRIALLRHTRSSFWCWSSKSRQCHLSGLRLKAPRLTCLSRYTCRRVWGSTLRRLGRFWDRDCSRARLLGCLSRRWYWSRAATHQTRRIAWFLQISKHLCSTSWKLSIQMACRPWRQRRSSRLKWSTWIQLCSSTPQTPPSCGCRPSSTTNSSPKASTAAAIIPSATAPPTPSPRTSSPRRRASPICQMRRGTRAKWGRRAIRITRWWIYWVRRTLRWIRCR